MKLVIFGCGTIANRIARSCKLVREIDLIGFASKDTDRAREYAEEYDVSEYGDYDHFLDGDVDAVYIATHNPSHYELISRCLQHHKNVMCEKPMLHSIRANKEMFELARENDVLLMEALKSVFLPINIKVKQMIDDKSIGDITEASASFMRNGHHPESHWINETKTGGALKDLGSYCVGTLNYLLGCQPEVVSITKDRYGTLADTTASILLDYDGISASVNVSNSIDGDMSLIIKGSRGYICVEDFWKTGKAYCYIDDRRYELDEELISDFYYELRHFACLTDNGIKESDIMSESASEGILAVTASPVI